MAQNQELKHSADTAQGMNDQGKGWVRDTIDDQKRRAARFETEQDAETIEGNSRSTAHSGEQERGDAFAATEDGQSPADQPDSAAPGRASEKLGPDAESALAGQQSGLGDSGAELGGLGPVGGISTPPGARQSFGQSSEQAPADIPLESVRLSDPLTPETLHVQTSQTDIGSNQATSAEAPSDGQTAQQPSPETGGPVPTAPQAQPDAPAVPDAPQPVAELPPLDIGFTAKRPDMPLDVPAPGEMVRLDVRLAGEAYRGDPAYEIIVDGVSVAKGKVDWARETTTEGLYDLNAGRDAVDWRDVSIDIPMPEGGFESVEVRFPNDAYRRGVGDRNLIVDRIALDGHEIQAESTEVHYQGGKFRGDTTSERMPWRGSLEFDVSDAFAGAAPIEAPDGPYVLEDTPGATVGTLDLSQIDPETITGIDVSDPRFEVVDATLRLREGMTLDHETEASVSVDILVTSSNGAQADLQIDIDVVDLVEVAPPVLEVEPSFVARYFDMDRGIRTLSDVDFAADPTHVDTIDSINFARTRGSFWEDGSADTFGAQITGVIDVPEDGVFTFSLGGDDGTVLLIDGVEVIDNDGLHAFRVDRGQVELDAGPHTIEVLYFENRGHAGLKLEWEGPGLEGRQLVSPAEPDNLTGLEGMPLDISVDLTCAGGCGPLALTGLPEGTLVDAGGVALVASEGGVDLTGQSLEHMSITPPPGFQGPVNATLSATDQRGATTEIALDFDVIAPPWAPDSTQSDPLAADADFLDQMDVAMAAHAPEAGDMSAELLDAQIEIVQDDSANQGAEFGLTADI